MSIPPADLRQGCRRAQLLAGMLLLALVTYAVVVESLARALAPFRGFAPDMDLGALRIVLAALAVASLAGARLLRHRLPRPAPPTVQHLLTGSLVDLALSESIAVYGLVLFLLGGRALDFYTFAALSLAAFAVSFPRLAQWEAQAREAGRP